MLVYHSVLYDILSLEEFVFTLDVVQLLRELLHFVPELVHFEAPCGQHAVRDLRVVRLANARHLRIAAL